MKEVTGDSIVEPCLTAWGLIPCPVIQGLSMEGQCYKPAAHGDGYYWFYERNNMFAISIMDLRLTMDCVLEYQQPDFISVNYYDTISAEELIPYKRLNANCIRGHVSGGEFYRIRCHANTPIHGMELMLMPGYYENFLEERYPGEFPDSKSAFKSIDGITDFPELVLLMRQIQMFQGTGAVAHLFYESKISEAISLVIEKTKNRKGFVPSGSLSENDLINLDAVKSFIDDHFAFEIHTEQLTKIACMGQTKLRYAFKNKYGYTITEYIQNKRIAHAEYLLIKTDFPISQVAQAVGNHHVGRFSKMFKDSVGLSPTEYRKIHL